MVEYIALPPASLQEKWGGLGSVIVGVLLGSTHIPYAVFLKQLGVMTVEN